MLLLLRKLSLVRILVKVDSTETFLCACLRMVCFEESEKEFVEKQNGELQRQMNSVYVMSDDERRASNEEMAALQLRLAQMEQEAAEVDAMRDQLKALQNKLKSADRTADSFKRLYMSEKNKNGSVESDVKTAVPSISTMTRVTRAASSQFEPGVTIKQEIQPNVDDESVSRLRGSRQAVSASCLVGFRDQSIEYHIVSF